MTEIWNPYGKLPPIPSTKIIWSRPRNWTCKPKTKPPSAPHYSSFVQGQRFCSHFLFDHFRSFWTQTFSKIPLMPKHNHQPQCQSKGGCKVVDNPSLCWQEGKGVWKGAADSTALTVCLLQLTGWLDKGVRPGHGEEGIIFPVCHGQQPMYTKT